MCSCDMCVHYLCSCIDAYLLYSYSTLIDLSMVKDLELVEPHWALEVLLLKLGQVPLPGPFFHLCHLSRLRKSGKNLFPKSRPKGKVTVRKNCPKGNTRETKGSPRGKGTESKG